MSCTLFFPSSNQTLSVFNGKISIPETFFIKVYPMQLFSIEAMINVGTQEIKVHLQRTINHLEEYGCFEECLSSVYKVNAIPLTRSDRFFPCTSISVHDSPEPSSQNFIDLSSPKDESVACAAPERSLMEVLKSAS